MFIVVTFVTNYTTVSDGLFHGEVWRGSNERIGNGYSKFASEENMPDDRP